MRNSFLFLADSQSKSQRKLLALTLMLHTHAEEKRVTSSPDIA